MKNYFSFLFAILIFANTFEDTCQDRVHLENEGKILPSISQKKKKFYQSFIKKKKKKPSRRGNFLRNREGEEIGWKSWRARLSLYIEGLLFSVLVGILFNSKAKTRLPT